MTAFSVVEVAKPNIGENHPSSVRADVTITLNVRQQIKGEWEGEKVFFFLSLINSEFFHISFPFLSKYCFNNLWKNLSLNIKNLWMIVLMGSANWGRLWKSFKDILKPVDSSLPSLFFPRNNVQVERVVISQPVCGGLNVNGFVWFSSTQLFQVSFLPFLSFFFSFFLGGGWGWRMVRDSDVWSFRKYLKFSHLC